MVGDRNSPHHELVGLKGLLTFGVQARTVVAKRIAASALHDVVTFDVIAFGTLIVVVIPLRIVRSLGVPRRLVTHGFVVSRNGVYSGRVIVLIFVCYNVVR